MKKYVMPFLKSGPNRSQDPITRAKLQRAHLNNIIKMADEGTLVMAGPFFGDGDIRGIYIFNVESIEEAKILTETDPLIRSGGLIMELHYGMEVQTYNKWVKFIKLLRKRVLNNLIL